MATLVPPPTCFKLAYKGERNDKPYIIYRALPCTYPEGSLVPCSKKSLGFTDPPRRMAKAKPVPPEHPRIPVEFAPRKVKIPEKASGANKNKVFNTKFGTMTMQQVNQLALGRRYTTTMARQTNEVSIPMCDLEVPGFLKEPRPDQVCYRAQRYDDEPEFWQSTSVWDRIQSRGPTDTGPYTEMKNKPWGPLRLPPPLVSEAEKDMLRSHVRSNTLSHPYVAKIPLYGGHKALCQPEMAKMAVPSPPHLTSCMESSYKPIPQYMLKKAQFGHRQMFGKTTCVAQPCNPFNTKGSEQFKESEMMYTDVYHRSSHKTPPSPPGKGFN